jgi:heat shock protein HslJ
MSGKTGKRPTGRKPMTSTRTGAKTDGAFGKENINRVSSEIERDEDRSTSTRLKAEK